MVAPSGAPSQNTAVPGTCTVPAEGLRWRRAFPGEERRLSLLRRWIASLLPECPARDDVAVIANELSSNAIRHTASGRGGWFAVEVTWYGPVVRVAVADSGAPTAPRVIDDPASEHGRGLLVVRELSMHMGVCGDGRGRLMWADVRWDASPAAAVATPDADEAAIRDGQAALARRFAGVPAWLGRATLAWWALADPGGLVSAPPRRPLPLRAGPATRRPADTGPAGHHDGHRGGMINVRRHAGTSPHPVAAAGIAGLRAAPGSPAHSPASP